MPFLPTDFPGLFLIEPAVFEDSRGYFFESYNEKWFREAGLHYHWVQDNQSSSSYGVIRGLHYQLNPKPQTKLVRVLHGAILDVVVDIRVGSPTYGKSYAVELNDRNRLQLLVPAGFAHGFSVLSEKAEVLYKCDGFYDRPSEGGILYNDPALAIDWRIPADKAIVSDKDLALPLFKNCQNNFVYGSI